MKHSILEFSHKLRYCSITHNSSIQVEFIDLLDNKKQKRLMTFSIRNKLYDVMLNLNRAKQVKVIECKYDEVRYNNCSEYSGGLKEEYPELFL